MSMRAFVPSGDSGYSAQRVAAAFSRAVGGYDRHASLQHQVADDLASYLAGCSIPAGCHVLEIGCGTGLLPRCLATYHPVWLERAWWVLTDIASPMVTQARDRLVDFPAALSSTACSVEALPFDAGRFGLICSSLALQWAVNLRRTLESLISLLAPGGVLCVNFLAQGSLGVWHDALAAHNLRPAAPVYPTLDDLDSWVPQQDHLRQQDYHVCYADALTFLRTLQALGATTPVAGYAPVGAGTMRRVLRRLPRPFDVTYQVATLCYRHQESR